MARMIAALLPKTGPQVIVHPSSIYIPKPTNDQSLIRIVFCGVNHLDILIKQGKRVGPKRFPHILGSEIVGVIDSIRSKASGFKQGDAVAAYPWTFCGTCDLCRTGYENICDQGGTIGRTDWGGYAQFVTVPIRNLIKIPKGVSLESVCSVTLAGTTAYHLIDRAKIKNKSVVLVTGATGGVGTLVIQLLKHKSCTVHATTSNKTKIALLKKLGVDLVVPTEQLVTTMRKAYPQGVQYVIDIMGGSVWSAAAEVVAKNGTMVYCATTLDGQGTINIGSAFSRQINVRGSYGGTRKDLQAVIRLIKKGVLKPVIDSIYSLKNANDALIKLENKEVFGKILIKT